MGELKLLDHGQLVWDDRHEFIEMMAGLWLRMGRYGRIKAECCRTDSKVSVVKSKGIIL